MFKNKKIIIIILILIIFSAGAGFFILGEGENVIQNIYFTNIVVQ
ncbi:hypothetical protein [Clostridioides difficile]